MGQIGRYHELCKKSISLWRLQAFQYLKTYRIIFYYGCCFKVSFAVKEVWFINAAIIILTSSTPRYDYYMAYRSKTLICIE